jgi:hypothetical protein
MLLTIKSFTAAASNPLLLGLKSARAGAAMYYSTQHLRLGFIYGLDQSCAQSTCADTVFMDDCKTKQQSRIHACVLSAAELFMTRIQQKKSLAVRQEQSLDQQGLSRRSRRKGT